MALQLGDDLEAVAVVIKPALPCETPVERILARMAERRVAEVMAERDGLGQIGVEAEGPRQSAGELRDLDGVGQAGAEMVALVVNEHLRLVGEATERA